MSGQAVPIRELVDGDTLLRAILTARALANLPDAFLLRFDEKDTGLSVRFDCSHDECRAGFRATYGVVSLTVGCVQALDLRVIHDEPTHANIKGLPYKEDDPDSAEWFAGRLAECATIVDRERRRRE